MQRYSLDETKFKQLLKQKGYTSVLEFSKQQKLNRTTLAHYLKGQGPLSETYYQLCESLEIDPLSLLNPVLDNNNIAFQDEILPIVQKISQKYNHVAVLLLGSRAKGKSKKYSDWDLGLTSGKHKLSTKDFSIIKTFIQDLADDLPRSVDVINLDNAPNWFLEAIDYEPIFLTGNKSASSFFLGVLDGIKK